MSKWNIFVDIHSIHTYISEIRVGDVGNSLAVCGYDSALS